nr:MAG TPA: hypothetical protein [Caudoviricetes sp.]
MYKVNKRKSKIFQRLSPIMFWFFMGLTIIFVILMSKNSIGNVTEILHLLDKDVYSGEQIEANYAALIEKWGEWEIIGENNSGFVVRYVDVRAALFSGLMITYMVLSIVCLCLAIIIGKILFPRLAKMYTDSNSEMVDIATLKTMSQVEEMTGKKSQKEWF